MNKENGDVTVSGAERPYSSEAEWLAQIHMVRGLIQRVALCYGCGEPSIVDLQDAGEALRLINTLNSNLLGEATQRAKDGAR